MRLSTAIVLLIWQAGKFWQLIEARRSRLRRIAFEDALDAFHGRHEENMKAIRKGLPLPYPNNAVEMPK